MKKKLKQMMAGGVCLALVLGNISGCGNAKGSETINTTENAETGSDMTESSGSREKVTLTFAASQNWIVDVDRELAKEFEKETGIAIDFQLSPDDQYQTIIKSKLNTGEGPDLFMSYSGTKLRDFNPAKNMADLSNEAWAGKLEQWAIDGNSIDGKLYAQNTAGVDDTNGVLYKPAVFERLGIKVPTNYKEFKDACDKLQAAGITPIYEFIKDLWHTHYWMEGASALALKNNPDLYTQLNTNKIGFADVPEFETALKELLEMEKAGYFGDSQWSNTYDNSYDAMTSGKYGMIIIHGSYPNELKMNVEGTNPDEFSMFPSPLADNQLITLTAGGTTKCINANSSHVKEAKQYLDFLARDDNIKKLYKEKTTYVSAAFKGQEASPTKAFKDLRSVAAGEAQGAEASVCFYDGSKISELIQEMFTGSLTPKQVLEEYDTTRRAIAKEAGQEGF